LKQRNEKNRLAVLRLTFDFEMADSVICASEKQRDLWMGLLMQQNRIIPSLYDQDNSLRNLIDVVPFGLSNEAPQKTGSGIREKYRLSPTDKVILWGGGIWNWFDPLSLIKAVKFLSGHRKDIKLVFMGLKNPDRQVPEMFMSHESIKLAKDLQLLDKHVFFNYGWVPYEERQNFLLDANIGASIHFDHLETRYSFRTRMLDYIWSQLPILATTGDSFAELIQANQLGAVVPYKDEFALATAITHLVDHSNQIKTIKDNLLKIKHQFTWNTVVEPIQAMIQQFTLLPAKRAGYNEMKVFSSFLSCYATTKIREKGIGSCFRLALNKILTNK
jgi:glycosyltransferase involved in cell wall biosynthesis